MNQIYVLRHAKSSWDDASLDDHERPLAERGRKAAVRIAAYIDDAGIRPELVLCSTARRARETFEGISEALGSPTVHFKSDLYDASAGEWLEVLRAIDDSVSSVMLIGHNPALGYLVLTLAGGGDDIDRVRNKFPTAALAMLSFDGAWHDLAGGATTIVGYVVPKDLK
jgi:phosphohistidine phosphatase